MGLTSRCSRSCRHSNVQTTLQVYTQAISEQKRAANVTGESNFVSECERVLELELQTEHVGFTVPTDPRVEVNSGSSKLSGHHHPLYRERVMFEA
jgi:hypothetical protein